MTSNARSGVALGTLGAETPWTHTRVTTGLFEARKIAEEL